VLYSYAYDVVLAFVNCSTQCHYISVAWPRRDYIMCTFFWLQDLAMCYIGLQWENAVTSLWSTPAAIVLHGSKKQWMLCAQNFDIIWFTFVEIMPGKPKVELWVILWYPWVGMLISFFSRNRFSFWKNRFFFDYRIWFCASLTVGLLMLQSHYVLAPT